MTQIIKTLKKFNLITLPTGAQIPEEPVTGSRDIYNVIKKIHLAEGNDFQEFFYVVFLNRCNKPTGFYVASFGGMTGTVADPRLIVKAAALAECTSVVISHNHPSGNLKPSRADEELTSKIKLALSYFDIKVLDHIILNNSEFSEYYSFADEGILY